jgi:hypothetical protein
MSNPGNFFSALAENFMDESLEPQDRHANATMLVTTMQEFYNDKTYWELMPPDLKNTIQNSGLCSLISPNYQIQKSAANLVSKVYVLRFRANNKWPDLIENLSKNVQSPKPEIQQASILTLGYLCEELHS